MKSIGIICIVVLSGVIVAISICSPKILSENEFLKNFINQEILNIMAVIMTISITTIATIHIWFNELEQKHGKRVFGKARREINQSAFLFIMLFIIQLMLLIVRSFFIGNEISISLFNGFSIVILICSVITLADIMGVVRSLTPDD